MFDDSHHWAIRRVRDGKTSSWLTLLPVARFQFDLSPQEFRDGLAIRCHRPLLIVPDVCDGCGSAFELSHALDCRKGGLVIQRHSEVRDAFGNLSTLVCKQVKPEPINIVREADSVTGAQALVC